MSPAGDSPVLPVETPAPSASPAPPPLVPTSEGQAAKPPARQVRPLGRATLVLSVALAFLLADQGSKYLAVRDLTHLFQRADSISVGQRLESFYGESKIEHLAGPNAILVRGFWQHRYTENPGAAFSLFDESPQLFRMIFFALTFLLACGFVLILAFRNGSAHPLRLIALGAILGGASGNFIDRLAHSYVIDFVDLLYTMPRWLNMATFNIADVGITLGGAAFLLTLLREARHS